MTREMDKKREIDIVAVVVTRDRLGLLKGCVEHLKNQSSKLKKIVVVDNDSSDGTKDWLSSLDDEQIVYMLNDKNEGGAGGFYHGIKIAYDIGCDYIWIMDDDTFATQDALMNLLDAYRVLKSKGRNVGFVTSNALYKDDAPCIMNVSTPSYIWNDFASEGLVRVTHSSFVAMLVPSSVVADVGLPIRKFFIWGDDGEYSTRIAQTYEGYMCGKSIVYHMMGENVGVNIFTTPVERIDRFYYFYRNWMFTNKIRSTESAQNYKKDCKRLMRHIYASDTPKKREKVRTIKRGLRDGEQFDAEIEYIDGTIKKIDPIATKSIILRKIRPTIISTACGAFNKFFGSDLRYLHHQYNKFTREHSETISKGVFLGKGVFRSKISYGGTRSDMFFDLMQNMDIKPIYKGSFVMSLDVYKNWHSIFRQFDNCSIDYDLIINHGLKELFIGDQDGFGKENDTIIQGMILYVTRLMKKVSRSRNKNKSDMLAHLSNFINQKATSVEDALQRICITSQLLWQTGHRLMGLGRLDYILDEYINNDDRTDQEITDVLVNFYKIMHEYYWYKSAVLMGDTGQIIILGGNNPDGTYFSNRLTHLFIKALEQSKLPDPKILLRVSSKTPDHLWDAALKCMTTGVCSPLFSNDDRVIPSLLDFGYDVDDAYNYTTSACWEPIPGNSYEQNNIGHINFASVFDLMSNKEELSQFETFETYLNSYKSHLAGHANFVARELDNIVWEFDPLMSALSKTCRSKRMDISVGGGKYNNYGVLTNALSNTVNSLLCIKELVFDKKILTLREFENARISNYRDKEVLEIIENANDHFGHDNEEIIALTNGLMDTVMSSTAEYRNKFGGRMKIGTSSPSYLTIGTNSPATFDGRLANTPYGVHISADGCVAFTELINFGAKLEYDCGKFNGNVIDIMTSPDFIEKHKDSFMDLLKGAVSIGAFQLQFNIISSEILKKAKEDPALYPNLIVRVWGFSAYFNELPMEYKDNLIRRAEKNESFNN